MKTLRVKPIRKIKGELTVPGDKSISHRAAMLAGIADGETHIRGFLNSEDCLATLHMMQALGVQVEQTAPCDYLVTGRPGKLLKPAEELDCGNSGTTMRLMAGLLSGQPFPYTLGGDASLSRRPMKRIAEPLTRMGATVTCEGPDHRPPITIQGGHLKGIEYQTPVPSAQVKSCVLLAGLHAGDKTSVTETAPSRDHTERMLRHFGASITRDGLTATVYGGHSLTAADITVPGDFSSAAFWLVAAAAMPGASLILHNVGLNPTRTGLLNILLRMKANIIEKEDASGAEPCGTVTIQEGSILQATEIGGDEIPNVIDELPIIAVAAALAEGTTTIKDAAELRVKETDRIAALATNLRAFGVPLDERPDGLVITGRAPLRGARVDSFGDHRIAMAFAILGLFARGETVITHPECIATSYPGFEEHLQTLTGRLRKKPAPST